MDLTTFIIYHLETDRSLEGLFASWDYLINNGGTLNDVKFEEFFSDKEKQLLFEVAKNSMAIQVAIENKKQSKKLKKIIENKEFTNAHVHDEIEEIYVEKFRPIEYYHSQHQLLEFIHKYVQGYELNDDITEEQMIDLYINHALPLHLIPHQFRNTGFFQNECMIKNKGYLIPKLNINEDFEESGKFAKLTFLIKMNSNVFKLKNIPITLQLARIYLLQAMNSNFGFADELNQAFLEKNLQIEEISLEEIKKFINTTGLIGLPETFFCFEKHLSLINESVDIEKELHKFKLYTDLIICSYDEGGLVVMENFGLQIYILCDAEGNEHTKYCHDLEIGPDGLIVCRFSDSSGDWLLGRYKIIKGLTWMKKNSSLLDLYHDGCRYFNGRDFIPGLRNKNFDGVNVDSVTLPPLSVKENTLKELKKVITKTPGLNLCAPTLIPFYFAYNELAIAGIKIDFRVYTLLDNNLRQNKNILQTFLTHAPFTFILVTIEESQLTSILKKERLLCLKWLRESQMVYELMNEAFRCEDEFVFALIENHKYCGDKLPEEVKSNNQLMLECLKIDGSILEHLNKETKNNSVAVLLAISNTPHSIKHVSNELKNDEEFIKKIIKTAPKAIKLLSNELKAHPHLMQIAKEMKLIETDLPSNDDLPF
jgi:hypothetical protein